MTAALVACAALFVAGLPIERLLRRDGDGLFGRLAATYLYGCLALGATLGGATALGVGVVGARSALLCVVVGAVAATIVLRRLRPRGASDGAREGVVSKAADIGVALVCLCVLLGCVAESREPIIGGDEAEIWAPKSHALWAKLDGESYATALREYSVAHPDYPPLCPLLQLMVHATAGGSIESSSRLPVSLCSVALLLGAYALMIRGVSGAWKFGAFAIVASLAAATEFRFDAPKATADGMVALGFLFAVEAAARFAKAPTASTFVRMLLAALFMAFAKNEGAAHATVVVALALGAVVASPRRREIRASSGAAIAIALLVGAVLYFFGVVLVNRSAGVVNDIVASAVPTIRDVDVSGRVARIGVYWAKDVVGAVGGAGALPFAAALVAIWSLARREGRRFDTAAWAIAIGGGIYAAAFALTPNELDWHLATAARRTYAQLAPASAVLLWRELSAFRRRDAACAPNPETDAASEFGGASIDSGRA